MHAEYSSTGGQYHRNPQNTTDLAGGRLNHKCRIEGTEDKRCALPAVTLLDIGLQCHSRISNSCHLYRCLVAADITKPYEILCSVPWAHTLSIEGAMRRLATTGLHCIMLTFSLSASLCCLCSNTQQKLTAYRPPCQAPRLQPDMQHLLCSLQIY